MRFGVTGYNYFRKSNTPLQIISISLKPPVKTAVYAVHHSLAVTTKSGFTPRIYKKHQIKSIKYQPIQICQTSIAKEKRIES